MDTDGGIAGAGGSGRRSVAALLLSVGAVVSALPGCAPRPPSKDAPAMPLAVQVYADTGRGERLRIQPPPARVWLARVTPARAAPPSPSPPPPEAGPEEPPGPLWPAPGTEADPALRPPVLRAPARLLLPGGRRRADGWVELDVWVDESGAVGEARWAAGSPDTALVEAARRCALGMRFYPALRSGRAVGVWCRQRFDFRAAAR